MILLCPPSAAGAGDFSGCWFAAARVPGVRLRSTVAWLWHRRSSGSRFLVALECWVSSFIVRLRYPFDSLALTLKPSLKPKIRELVLKRVSKETKHS